MIIVGGIYYEHCMAPYVKSIYGSGGRAAVALSRLDHDLKLYSYATRQAEKEFSAIASSCGFCLHHTPQDQQVEFSYTHPLSTPMISPHPLSIKRNASIEVNGDIVLQYGMLEGAAIVTSETAVYDPQDAYSPKMFHGGGSKTGRLGVVLNVREGRLLTGLVDEKEIVAKICHDDNASVVVLKMGARGALVYEGGNCNLIPCFKTKFVSPIGSGDIFSAIFAFEWARNGKNATDAAQNASAAVAEFCNMSTLPFATVKSPSEMGLVPISEEDIRKQPKVYLAGPFFTLPQLWMIEEARNVLHDFGLRVFSPYHDIGEGPGVEVAPKDMAAIRECEILFAILSGQDPGTIFEIGFARALDKPVVVFVENEKAEDLKMIEGSGCHIFSDFATAVYNARWIL